MKKITPNHDGSGLKIGIVRSRFNGPIVEQMLAACTRKLLALGVTDEDITLVDVPGALEIPLALQTMAMSSSGYHAMIAIGAVIRGDTYHFEIVANESCRGVSEVSLETGVPIANGILTTNTDEQALARVVEKGDDCAVVAVEMANCVRLLTREAGR